MTFGIRRDDLIARGKQLTKIQPVYGGVTYTTCYHLSKSCHRLEGNRRFEATGGTTKRYENAAAAFAAGHLRACEVCVAYITIDVDGEAVQVTPEQADVLATIARLRRIKSASGESKFAITLCDLAAGRGRSQVSTLKRIDVLAKKKMVTKDYDYRNKLKPGRGIELTELGQRVLDALPAY
jgi:hypothetical protein